MGYKNFNIIDRGDYACIEFDVPDSSANILSTETVKEYQLVLREILDSKYKAAVLISKKDKIFIAGADIHEIQNLKTKEEFDRAGKAGQDVFNEIEDAKIPFVAAIHGACVGGGCELAIACDYRIASDASSTKIGLPEVQLGLLPGFGGCVRLPRIVGLIQGLQIILPGKSVPAKKAKKIGLVDELIPEALFSQEVDKFMTQLISKGASKRKKVFKGSILDRLMHSPLLRWKIYSESRKSILKQTRGHYPAPLKALKVVQKTYKMSNRTRALQIERQGFCEVAVTDISKNLVQLFFWMEGVKKNTGVSLERNVQAQPITHMAVLGAGTMGGGIAQLAADKGIRVRMKDVTYEALMRGFQAAADIWNKKVKRRRLNASEFQQRMGLLSGGLDFSGFSSIDLVVEAIVEDMNVKKKVIAETIKHTGRECIIATNTSSLSVNEMSEAHPQPENFIGLHYFNPVHKMPLVEVIRGKKTSDQTTTTVFEFAKKMGKTPVVVQDGPGFLVNRLLLPWLSEALFILEDGLDIKAVDDKYTKVFGMPMGPFRLIDEIGIDVCNKVLKIFKNAFKDRMELSLLLDKFDDPQGLGKKTGRGFYIYDKKGRSKCIDSKIYSQLGLKSPTTSFNVQEVLDRGVLAMVNEASIALLEDKIVQTAKEVDLAMIFGTGFPPFRGGLLKYADSFGIQTLVDRLKTFESRWGYRFKPSMPLLELAQKGESFYKP